MEAPNPEREFIHNLLKDDIGDAIDNLAKWYLGNEVQAFREKLTVDIVNENERGSQIPSVRYDSRTRQMHMQVEPETMIHFADELAEGTDLSSRDIVRTLIGAGVARCVLGRKLLPIHLLGEKDPKRHELQRRLADKKALLAYAERFDAIHGTSLEGGVMRLGMAEISKTNVLRFAIGASLTHMSDAIEWPPQWYPAVEKRLEEAEHERVLDLITYMAIFKFKAETAFQFYDDTVAQLLLAMNFPMTPAEELSSFAVMPLR